MSKKSKTKLSKEEKKKLKKLYDFIYYSKNQEKRQQTTSKWLQQRPEIRIYNSSRANARKTNREFTLTIEDIVIPEYCPILGVKLTNILQHGKQRYNPSIDRIDTSKGYTKDNIHIVSFLANKMKNDATKEELIAFAKGVLRLHDTLQSS